MDPYIPVPPVHYGGIERIVHDLANQYVKMGHEVTLVAGPNSVSPGRLIIYGENGPISPRLNFKNIRQVYKILKAEIHNHDVIHNFGRLAYLLPFLRMDIPKVQSYLRHVTIKNIRIVDWLGPKNLIYTAVSNVIRDMGQTGNSKWQTVYNCTPVNEFTFRSQTKPDGYLAFIGRFERCKGLHNAIEVAKATQRELVIAGFVSDIPHEQQYFENEIKPQIDGKTIKWIGTVNNEERNQLLGKASALITPVEWSEPFPLILPEAYACGTPVLGFNRGGIAEGIDHGYTGYLSNTVAEMVADVNRLSELKRIDCRKKAVNSYSGEKIAADYINVYKSLFAPTAG